MIDGVPHQMDERFAQPVENDTIRLHVTADNVQPNFLANRGGEISHHTGECLASFGKWPHAKPPRARGELASGVSKSARVHPGVDGETCGLLGQSTQLVADIAPALS